jgi:hypothetical protein
MACSRAFFPKVPFIVISIVSGGRTPAASKAIVI